MAIAGTELAVGSDSGTVHILDLETLLPTRRIIQATLGSRILCLAWSLSSPAGNGTLLVGGIDSIECFSGRDLDQHHLVSIPREQTRRPTILWSLIVLCAFPLFPIDLHCQGRWRIREWRFAR